MSIPITLLSKRPPTQTPACPYPQRRGQQRSWLSSETPSRLRLDQSLDIFQTLLTPNPGDTQAQGPLRTPLPPMRWGKRQLLQNTGENCGGSGGLRREKGVPAAGICLA